MTLRGYACASIQFGDEKMFNHERIPNSGVKRTISKPAKFGSFVP